MSDSELGAKLNERVREVFKADSKMFSPENVQKVLQDALNDIAKRENIAPPSDVQVDPNDPSVFNFTIEMTPEMLDRFVYNCQCDGETPEQVLERLRKMNPEVKWEDYFVVAAVVTSDPSNRPETVERCWLVRRPNSLHLRFTVNESPATAP